MLQWGRENDILRRMLGHCSLLNMDTCPLSSGCTRMVPKAEQSCYYAAVSCEMAPPAVPGGQQVPRVGRIRREIRRPPEMKHKHDTRPTLRFARVLTASTAASPEPSDDDDAYAAPGTRSRRDPRQHPPVPPAPDPGRVRPERHEHRAVPHSSPARRRARGDDPSARAQRTVLQRTPRMRRARREPRRRRPRPPHSASAVATASDAVACPLFMIQASTRERRLLLLFASWDNIASSERGRHRRIGNRRPGRLCLVPLLGLLAEHRLDGVLLVVIILARIPARGVGR